MGLTRDTRALQPDIREFAFKKFPVCADKACLRTTAATFVGNNTSTAISSSTTQCWISPPFSKHNLGNWEFRWGHGSSRLHDLLSAIQSWKTTMARLTTALQSRSNYLCISERKPGRNPLIPKTFPFAAPSTTATATSRPASANVLCHQQVFCAKA